MNDYWIGCLTTIQLFCQSDFCLQINNPKLLKITSPEQIRIFTNKSPVLMPMGI